MTAPASPQAAQTGLVMVMGADLEVAWSQLDVGDLAKSLPVFTAQVAALTTRYGKASATLSALQYRDARRAAGFASPFTVKPAPPAGLRQVGQSMDWATQPLWSTDPDLKSVKTLVDGAAEKLVLDAGRHTIVTNVQRDPKAHGWARLTEAAPCSFCALLAIRGAVYRSDRSADFKAHDHCRCHAEPLFAPYEPSAQIRQWQQLYRDSTTGGNAARTRRQWRQAFEAQPN